MSVKETEKVKKMKLVISDLHLGGGRLLPNGMTNSLEEFLYEEKLAEFLHFYTTGEYQDYEVELIINGDFLNLLQVDYKGHYLTVVTESVSLEKLKNIIQGHPKAFKALRDFVKLGNNSIAYVIGNHDQGMLWPATRNYLNEVLNTNIRYKNLVYFFDGIHIEHGHMQESANRWDPKKFFLKKNLPEPILNLPFGSHFFVDFVIRLKLTHPYIDKIRPFQRFIRWAFFNETRFTVRTFFQLLVYLIRALVWKDPRKSWNLKSILKTLVESAIFPDLEASVLKLLSDPRVNTVIFGHSHVYQYRQWEGKKEYFNTGTWTELTSLDISSLGMLTKLTYVQIVYPENGDPPHGRLKLWRGYYRIEEDVAIS